MNLKNKFKETWHTNAGALNLFFLFYKRVKRVCLTSRYSLLIVSQ